jgi:uncharacterized protein YjbI with pentapeptide repeats
MKSSKDRPIRKGWRVYLNRIVITFIKITYSFIKWVFHYLGFEFIYRKFNPSKKSGAFPTGVIWLIGIYVAFFGVASQRYENRVDIIENRANSIFAQLATHVYKKALSRIPTVQNMGCPEKPELFNPLSVFRSLFKEMKYQELMILLKETLEDWKEELNGVKLNNANLQGANLQGANLQGANLQGANLKGAKLFGADLSGANLAATKMALKPNSPFLTLTPGGSYVVYVVDHINSRTYPYIDDHNLYLLLGADLRELKSYGGVSLHGANLNGTNFRKAFLFGANLQEAYLQKADLQEADLTGANLQGANLQGANLKGAKLRGTNLKGAKVYKGDLLCVALDMTNAQLDKKIEAQINQKCPSLLKSKRFEVWVR